MKLIDEKYFEFGKLKLYCFEQPSCGNGIVESTEWCDDGNQSNNDGCSSLCNYGKGSSGGTPKDVVGPPRDGLTA